MKSAREERWQLLLILGAVGMILGLTNLLGPLHEAAHVASAARHGVDAEITSWTTATIHGKDFTALMAGWTWELVWAVMIAIAVSIVGRKSKRWFWLTGGAALGYGLTTWFRGFTSYDFNDGMRSMVMYALNDKTMINEVWDEVHKMINVRWGLIGGVVLVIGMIVVLRNTFKRKGVA
jgi:hypothetical protein